MEKEDRQRVDEEGSNELSEDENCLTSRIFQTFPAWLVAGNRNSLQPGGRCS